MATDRWDIDSDVLEAVVEAEATSTRATSNINLFKIMQDAGIKLSSDELVKSLERLNGSYLDVNFYRAGGGTYSYQLRGVTERGRRATRQWPGEEAYSTLVEVLTQRVEAAGDEPTKGRLRVALDAIVGLGHDVGVDIASEVIRKQMGV